MFLVCFFSGVFCLFVLFLVGGVCLYSEKICMGVGTVCMCMNALENNLFKKGFSERKSL